MCRNQRGQYQKENIIVTEQKVAIIMVINIVAYAFQSSTI